MSDAYCVYRCFDAGGALLYVGCSANVDQRLRLHRYYSPWYSQVTLVTQDLSANREEGLEREREAIIDERPLYNITHAPVKRRVQGSKEMHDALYATKSFAADGWLTLPQAAARYGMARSTLAAHARRGTLIACRLGVTWCTSTEEMDRYCRGRSIDIPNAGRHP